MAGPKQTLRILGALLLLGSAGTVAADRAGAASRTDRRAAAASPDPALAEQARREGRVVVYSVLSTKAARPLIDDFMTLYPGIVHVFFVRR